MSALKEHKRQIYNAWYARHRAEACAKKQAIKVARRARVLALLGGVCVSCGVDAGLDVDHIDPSTKSKDMFWRGAWDSIQDELAGCQLLCRPCHVMKTTAEGGWHGGR